MSRQLAAVPTAHPESPEASASPSPAIDPFRLPVEPLDEAITLAGGLAELGFQRTGTMSPERAREVERVNRSWRRARKQGWITIWAADDLCAHVLGVHAAFVFGDMWWDTLADIDSHLGLDAGTDTAAAGVAGAVAPPVPVSA